MSDDLKPEVLWVSPPIEEYMNKRERIAAMCLQGMMANRDNDHIESDELAGIAIMHAESLLRALDKP